MVQRKYGVVSAFFVLPSPSHLPGIYHSQVDRLIDSDASGSIPPVEPHGIEILPSVHTSLSISTIDKEGNGTAVRLFQLQG